MQHVPAALTPVAGLLTVAALVAPIEFYRTRQRLRRWARLRGWSYERRGDTWAGLAQRLAGSEAVGRVGLVLTGQFDGWDAVVLHLPATTGRRAEDRSGRTLVAVRVRPDEQLLTTVTRPWPAAAVEGRAALPAGAAVRNGWVVLEAAGPATVERVTGLLPGAVRAARQLSCPAPVEATPAA